MEIQNKKIPEGEFMKLRQEVLTQWPTGQGVDLEDAFAFHKSLPQEKSFPKSSSLPSSSVKLWSSPGPSVPVIEEHVKLLQFLQNEGEADLLPSTIDSYTRQNRYEEAENGIRESMRLGRAMLNPAFHASQPRRIRLPVTW
ncbi:MAG: hypothetical protein ACLSHU_04665 [Oscillospiraceae bacterium]